MKKEFELLFDYLDEGHKIKAGTKFTIKLLTYNGIQTSVGIISYDVFKLFVKKL